MRGWRSVLVLAAGSLVACSSIGSNTKKPAPVVVHGSSVRSGTRLLVELEQGLGSGSTPGQLYTAKVIQPVLDDKGQPVIPEGTEVIGHVREVQKGFGDTPATIHLTLDALLVHGVEHPLTGRFVAADPHPHKEVASSAAHAAGRGAVTGSLGGPPGMIIGSLLGATSGTVISLLRVSSESLPQGSTLTLQIDRSIPLAALRTPTG